MTFSDPLKMRALRDVLRSCASNAPPTVSRSLLECSLLAGKALQLEPFFKKSGLVVPVRNGEMLVLTNRSMVEVGASVCT